MEYETVGVYPCDVQSAVSESEMKQGEDGWRLVTDTTGNVCCR